MRPPPSPLIPDPHPPIPDPQPLIPDPHPLNPKQSPIGIFDSGVGGLSVLQQIQQLLPGEDLIYFADQAHVPYGPRPVNEVRLLCQGISSFLFARGAKIIVVACNTASAAALNYLRNTFPDHLFVGMEPAIKPGAHVTQSGKIGVLATPSTFDSGRYARLMSRFAGDTEVYEDTCRGLVELIEDGQIESEAARIILERAIIPMVRTGIDTLVLGCTHYPFVLPLIHQIAGPDVAIIDPAPAVAQQVQRVLESSDLMAPRERKGKIKTYTTADIEPFSLSINKLTGAALPAAKVYWSNSLTISAQ